MLLLLYMFKMSHRCETSTESKTNKYAGTEYLKEINGFKNHPTWSEEFLPADKNYNNYSHRETVISLHSYRQVISCVLAQFECMNFRSDDLLVTLIQVFNCDGFLDFLAIFPSEVLWTKCSKSHKVSSISLKLYLMTVYA